MLLQIFYPRNVYLPKDHYEPSPEMVSMSKCWVWFMHYYGTALHDQIVIIHNDQIAIIHNGTYLIQ